jgi:uncharacterized membrane protein YkvA (DUF1232 family)
MKNVFFNAALNKAAKMAGKPARLIVLVSQLAMKLRHVNWKNVDAVSLKEKLNVLGRLIKAYALGHYRAVPWKTLLIMIAAVIYFINPIDLIPDLIPVLGFTDDVGVLVWVYNAVNFEVDKFIAWEKTKLSV